MSAVDHSNILKPVATASGLPNENYISGEVFEVVEKRNSGAKNSPAPAGS